MKTYFHNVSYIFALCLKMCSYYVWGYVYTKFMDFLLNDWSHINIDETVPIVENEILHTFKIFSIWNIFHFIYWHFETNAVYLFVTFQTLKMLKTIQMFCILFRHFQTSWEKIKKVNRSWFCICQPLLVLFTVALCTNLLIRALEHPLNLQQCKCYSCLTRRWERCTISSL